MSDTSRPRTATSEAPPLVLRTRAGKLPRREFLRRCAQLGLSASTASLLLGCITKRTPPPSDEAAVSAAGPLERELRIFNWSDYIGHTTVADFEREFGVRVSYDTYESNEELLAKLVAGGGGYDIICPTGYLVPLLAEAGMLQPLDHGVLSNWNNLLPLFAAQGVDAGGRYAMPYQWGMTVESLREARGRARVPPAQRTRRRATGGSLLVERGGIRLAAERQCDPAHRPRALAAQRRDRARQCASDRRDTCGARAAQEPRQRGGPRVGRVGAQPRLPVARHCRLSISRARLRRAAASTTTSTLRPCGTASVPAIRTSK